MHVGIISTEVTAEVAREDDIAQGEGGDVGEGEHSSQERGQRQGSGILLDGG